MRSTASCAFASLFVIGVGIANAQIAPIYGRFYRFDVVAAVGQAGVTFISPAPSVNDNGLVALAAMTGAGPQVIVGDGIQPPKIIPFASESIYIGNVAA